MSGPPRRGAGGAGAAPCAAGPATASRGPRSSSRSLARGGHRAARAALEGVAARTRRSWAGRLGRLGAHRRWAAVALAFVVSTWTRDEAPSTGSSEVAALGAPPTPVPQEHPGLAGSTPPPAAAPNRAGRLSARVTSAKKATSGSTAVATAQSLDEGATVKTERGWPAVGGHSRMGRVWGSRDTPR